MICLPSYQPLSNSLLSIKYIWSLKAQFISVLSLNLILFILSTLKYSGLLTLIYQTQFSNHLFLFLCLLFVLFSSFFSIYFILLLSFFSFFNSFLFNFFSFNFYLFLLLSFFLFFITLFFGLLFLALFLALIWWLFLNDKFLALFFFCNLFCLSLI